MRLAKCLKSRLTEDNKEETKRKKRKEKKKERNVFLSLSVCSAFSLCSVIRFVFHVRHSVGTKSDVSPPPGFCLFGSKKESLPRSFWEAIVVIFFLGHSQPRR